jgi:predicted XRE-type DNA-binding protein
MARTAKVVPSDSHKVFEDLGFAEPEAENLRVRAFLMVELEELIRRRGLTQTEAAELFGVAQPRVSDLVRGKIDHFTIDSLLNMLTQAGLEVEVRVGR